MPPRLDESRVVSRCHHKNRAVTHSFLYIPASDCCFYPASPCGGPLHTALVPMSTTLSSLSILRVGSVPFQLHMARWASRPQLVVCSRMCSGCGHGWPTHSLVMSVSWSNGTLSRATDEIKISSRRKTSLWSDICHYSSSPTAECRR